MSKEKKPKSKKAAAVGYKVCDKCGAHLDPAADICGQCKGKKFAPEFVRDLRRVNRQLCVQVALPPPDQKTGVQPSEVISLYKWWPGGNRSFNIRNAEQWEKIKASIDNELGPLIGWPKPASVEAATAAAVPTIQLSQLAEQYPERFAELLGSVKVALDSPLSEEGLGVFSAAAELVIELDRASLERLGNVLGSLKSTSSGDLAKLDEVLANWSVTQVTAVVREVKRRIATIELLKERLKDDSTYEIAGDNSIHSILERDLWLLDESYWLIHSNRTLKTFIGDRLTDQDKKKHGKKRPDFVCGTLGDKLIIVELKRPSHNLTVDDLNQAETYMALADQYSQKFSSTRAFLLGSTIPPEVARHLKFRRGIEVMSYWELLDAAEQRYQEFLKHREPTQSQSGPASTPPAGVPRRTRPVKAAHSSAAAAPARVRPRR